MKLKTVRLCTRTLLIVLCWIGGTLSHPVTLLAWTNQPNSVTAVAWSFAGTRLASGYKNGTVRIQNVQTGQIAFTLHGGTDEVYTLAWSPDGSKLAAGNADTTIRVWDTSNAQVLITLTDYSDRVTTVAWSPNSTELASAGPDESQVLQIWNASTGKKRIVSAGSIAQLAWSPDGNKLALANVTGAVDVHDAATLQNVGHFEIITGDSDGIYAVAWSPDSNRIVAGSLDGTVRIWSMVTQSPLASFPGNDLHMAVWQTSAIRCVAFTSDGSKIGSISADGTMRIADASTGQILSTTQIGDGILAAAWSPDMTRIAYGGDSGSVHVSPSALAPTVTPTHTQP